MTNRSALRARPAMPCMLLAMAGAAVAHEAVIRVSVDSNGVEGDGKSGKYSRSSVSGDGRYVAFESDAGNLVAADANGLADVFVHDRVTGATVRVSVDSSGADADGESMGPSLSTDGRYVAFVSAASDLVTGDANNRSDVFVHDRDPDGNGTFDEGNGVTARVSVSSSGVEGDGFCGSCSISADGSVVAFASAASTLVANDTNGVSDVFVHDRSTALTVRVSVSSAGLQADNYSFDPSISGDGMVVAFDSWATNLVSGDKNKSVDVFVRDRAKSTTRRVSVSSSGAEGDYDSVLPSLSSDGEVVAFASYATNLVPGDSNATYDVFVHERATATTTRVSVDSSGVEGNDFSSGPAISADGQRVAFCSYSDNLVPGDSNGGLDVFVHDRATGSTSLSSANCSDVPGNGFSFEPSISGDGLLVAFTSWADDLVHGDTNLVDDIFLRDQSVAAGASWANYGAGFPGTHGVPAFTARADPVLGSTVTIDLGNSYGGATAAVVLIGVAETLLTTDRGGDLLVVPVQAILLSLPSGGTTLDGGIPDDDALCGLEAFAQALEVDPGAAKRLSFTAGLKLRFGR